MTWNDVLKEARTQIGPYCKACPVCNGKACKNQMPGPGAKGVGDTAIRNYEKWQEIRVNMDTIVPLKPVDTTLELFGKTFRYPIFAGPVGAVKMHYGEKFTDMEYNAILVPACAEAGIAWTNCPGCNAGSVEQYIHSALLLLKREKNLSLKDTTLGVVGVGHVGSRVAAMAQSLGMRVLLNDPPRAAKGEKGFDTLEVLAAECDILTFHTPLHREGIYKTFHLADEDFLFSLKRCPYLINSSRGEVVDTAALLAAKAAGKVKEVIIDTWEYEPAISKELLEVAYIATPHIAGYSADGKANATRMSLEALCRFFQLDAKFEILPPSLPCMEFSSDEEEAFLQRYNPVRDSEWLKKSPEKFEWFRGNYPLRRE